MQLDISKSSILISSNADNPISFSEFGSFKFFITLFAIAPLVIFVSFLQLDKSTFSKLLHMNA